MSKALVAALTVSMTATGLMVGLIGGYAGSRAWHGDAALDAPTPRYAAGQQGGAPSQPGPAQYQPGPYQLPPPPAAQYAATQPTVPVAPRAAPAVGPDPLQSPKVASEIMAKLAKLDGVVTGDGHGAVPADKMVQVFFDPRCPYCHIAFGELAGAVPVHWIPVVALGDEANGDALSAAILTAAGTPAADGASPGQAAMAQAFERKLAGIPATDAIKYALRQNLEAFVVMNSRQPRLMGVPTILVPKADGTVAMHTGYDSGKGDKQAIIAEYGGRP